MIKHIVLGFMLGSMVVFAGVYASATLTSKLNPELESLSCTELETLISFSVYESTRALELYEHCSSLVKQDLCFSFMGASVYWETINKVIGKELRARQSSCSV